MITIRRPIERVSALWGRQSIDKSAVYRQMRYTLRTDYDGNVLLHNVVTNHLVMLSKDEALALESCPCVYIPKMQALIADHFLVPLDYDESQQVQSIRKILLASLENQRPKGVSHYTIFPTTACNARCYYCYEHGVRPHTMSEHVANDLVEFIDKNIVDGKGVLISWFGGEPTVATQRIDQISQGLCERGIDYSSTMTTNGYLFDEPMVSRAISLWHLQHVMICVDGTEEKYNRIKAYVGVRDNPYQRVMRNVGLLLDAGISVNLRMNFDLNNYMDFAGIVDEAVTRFAGKPGLYINVHPVVGEYPDSEGRISHGDDAWFERKILELSNIARMKGLIVGTGDALPHLKFSGCQATNDAALVVTAEGNLVSCPEQFGADQVIGTIYEGVTNTGLVNSWRRLAEIDGCKNCVFYPQCVHVLGCSEAGTCLHLPELIESTKVAMVSHYVNFSDSLENEEAG